MFKSVMPRFVIVLHTSLGLCRRNEHNILRSASPRLGRWLADSNMFRLSWCCSRLTVLLKSCHNVLSFLLLPIDMFSFVVVAGARRIWWRKTGKLIGASRLRAGETENRIEYFL